MKYLFQLAFFCCLTLIGCDRIYEGDAITRKEYYSFSPQGGSKTDEVVEVISRKAFKQAKWNYVALRTTIYKVPHTAGETKEERITPRQLPNGETEIDGDWVKFIYPSNKAWVRIEVAPNHTGYTRVADLVIDNKSAVHWSLCTIYQEADSTTTE